MTPLINSRDLVRVAPVDPASLEVGDIVLARVAGTVYLHLISAVDPTRHRVQISNNHGRVNGWTGYDRVFGICVQVRGTTRAGAEAKVRAARPDNTPVPLKIVRGDATSPQAKGPKLIAHICNDLGGWGKGFVVDISRRWPGPERAYRQWHRDRARTDFGLGAVQVLQVGADMWVANMVAQHGMRTGSSGPPIRYEAVDQCLATLGEHAARLSASVHMPRIGCGLAGGRWDRIEPMVITHLCARGIATTVYDFD